MTYRLKLFLLVVIVSLLLASGCSPSDTASELLEIDIETLEKMGLGDQPAEFGSEANLALNLDQVGYPHPLESDRGWGGGADTWEIIDGTRNYEDWQHGLAFTGGMEPYFEPAGWRQVTIDFGQPTTFNCVVVWHHCSKELEHTPNTYKIEYWDGDEWVEVFSTTKGRDHLWYKTDDPNQWWEFWSTPTVNVFEPVTGSKVRFALDNRDLVHGWIYEFEVYHYGDTTPEAATGSPTEPEPGPGEEWVYDEDHMCGNPYFPAALGISHTYETSGTGMYGIEVETSYTSTITGVGENGFTVTTEMYDHNTQQSSVQEHQVECLPEGLIDYTSFSGLQDLLVDNEGVAAVGTEAEVTGISIPRSMSIGDTWAQSYHGSLIMEEGAEVEYSGTFNMSAVSEDTVTVPAGTFTALRVDSEIEIEYVMITQGTKIPYMTDTATASTWYVRGVGIVKITANHVITGMIGGEVTATTELTGYSLP